MLLETFIMFVENLLRLILLQGKKNEIIDNLRIFDFSLKGVLKKYYPTLTNYKLSNPASDMFLNVKTRNILKRCMPYVLTYLSIN